MQYRVVLYKFFYVVVHNVFYVFAQMGTKCCEQHYNRNRRMPAESLLS